VYKVIDQAGNLSSGVAGDGHFWQVASNFYGLGSWVGIRRTANGQINTISDSEMLPKVLVFQAFQSIAVLNI
jgi:hypothetical protein